MLRLRAVPDAEVTGNEDGARWIDEIRADTREMKWRLEHLYESSTVGVIRSESRDMKRTLESLDRKLESLSIKLESLDEKLKR